MSPIVAIGKLWWSMITEEKEAAGFSAMSVSTGFWSVLHAIMTGSYFSILIRLSC